MKNATRVALALGVAKIAEVDAVDSSINPLKKVVSMVREMKVATEKEMKEDDEVYAKYECWCTTTDKEKTAAIAAASDKLDELASFMEEGAARSSQLKTDIETLAKEIEADMEALASAAAIREKDHATYETVTADQKETLSALKNALEKLAAVNLMQKKGEVSADVATDVQTSLMQVHRIVKHKFSKFADVMEKDLFDVLGSLKGSESAAQKSKETFESVAFLGEMFLPKKEAIALEQSEDPSQGGAAKGAKSYNSRSGAIYGLLGAMKDQFTRDLAAAEEAEKVAVEGFAKLKATKESEIASGTEQKDNKERELADLTQKLAQADQDTVATAKAKAADEEFQANLQEGCATEAKNYQGRVKIRSEEIKALAETLQILTDDDARELLAKTTANFLQLSQSDEHAAINRASKKMALIAKKQGSWLLASLAVRMKLDGFEKIKAVMDKMMAELKQQQKDEYDKNERCKSDIDKTEDDIKVSEIEKRDLAAKHKQITNNLATLGDDIVQLQTEVSNMKVDLKGASENRKSENLDFQQVVSDQTVTIDILNKALARLKEFYGDSLVQVKRHGAAPPPPKPAAYEKRPAGGILFMLENIIKDAEETLAKAKTDEQSSQAEYIKLVGDTKASIAANEDAILEKKGILADSEGAKAETEESQLANEENLKNLNDSLTAHHADCDWVVKYFDIRQQARQEEMDSIADAKAILSGAGGASLAQQRANDEFDEQ